MTRHDDLLDQEYAPKAAVSAVERARRNDAKRIAHARRQAQPIEDATEHTQAVEDLAATLGTTVRRKKARP